MNAYLRGACAALALGPAALAQAYDLPSVNLGNTSLYDGSPAPDGPGLYLEQYVVAGKASRFNDSGGHKLALPKQDLTTFVPVTQLIYVAPPLANGAMPGVTLIQPWLAHADVDDGLGGQALNAHSGLGDLTLGAFLQLPTRLRGDGGPRWTQRVELDVVAPTGRYDRDTAINPGSHFWSVIPHYSTTLWFTPQWSMSGRFHYLWNGKNTAPLDSFGDVGDTQAGQALYANLTLQYAVNERLSVGLNGYWLRQITDTQVDGHDVAGRRERVWAIGPGMSYVFNRQNILTVNAYAEQQAENRTEGSKVVFNFLHRL